MESPERTLPRALALSVCSVVVCTGLPLLVAAGNDRFWRCWEEGSINAVMAQLCGPWLGAWAVLSSAVRCTGLNPCTRSISLPRSCVAEACILETGQVGNCGMFSAEFLEDTHQLEGMACVGLAPEVFQVRSKRFGTPMNAMLFQLVFLVLLVGLDFRAIMCVICKRMPSHGPLSLSRVPLSRACARASQSEPGPSGASTTSSR